MPYFIQSATTGFIASIFPSRNRVSPKEAFEGPEPYDGKLSRPVLRGLAPSNGGWLLGDACLQQLSVYSSLIATADAEDEADPHPNRLAT